MQENDSFVEKAVLALLKTKKLTKVYEGLVSEDVWNDTLEEAFEFLLIAEELGFSNGPMASDDILECSNLRYEDTLSRLLKELDDNFRAKLKEALPALFE